MESTPPTQAIVTTSTKDQIAIRKEENKSLVHFEEARSVDSIKYVACADVLEKSLSVAINRFTLDNKELQEKMRTSFFEISKKL